MSACLFKCIYHKVLFLYKQIKSSHSTGVPKLNPGYSTVSLGLNQINLII